MYEKGEEVLRTSSDLIGMPHYRSALFFAKKRLIFEREAFFLQKTINSSRKQKKAHIGEI